MVCAFCTTPSYPAKLTNIKTIQDRPTELEGDAIEKPAMAR
jgi:hypothetical protein